MDQGFYAILACAALAAAGAFFYWSGRVRKRRRQKDEYIRRLEQSQSRLQEHIAKLEHLVEMTLDLHQRGAVGTGPVSREDLCQAVTLNACRLLRARRGALLLSRPEESGFDLAGWFGLTVDPGKPFDLHHGESIARRAAQSGDIMFVEDIQTDKRFLRAPHPPLESRIMAVAPLRVRDRFLGVLIVHGDENRPWEERDLRLLKCLADQSAVSLENLALCDYLWKANNDMTQTLVQAMDVKQSYFRKQAEHIRFYARGLVKELSLPESMAQSVEYALLLRDVGKSAVSKSILFKPGKLTEEEYKIMKRNPETGSRIVSPIPFLAPIAPLVLYHREWFNGRGYPHGLAGEEIPLGARLTSVISAWDAMTSDRPFRKALSEDRALEELKKGAGTQFDPEVVQAFLRFLDRSGDESPRPPKE